LGRFAFMRTLRLAPLLAAALLTALFATYYFKTVRWMVEGGLEAGAASFPRICWDLRSDIDVIVWRAFPESRQWAHSGWRLFHYGDAPEGTASVAYFPSWYLLIPLAALWGFGGFLAHGHRGRPNPAPSGKGAGALLSNAGRPGHAVPEPQRSTT
jgi:hypothetical protein